MPPANPTAVNDVWQYDDLMRRGIQVLFTTTEDSLLDERRKMYRRDLLVILDAVAREDFSIDNAEFTEALEILRSRAAGANLLRGARRIEAQRLRDAAAFDVVGDKLPPLALDETQRGANIDPILDETQISGEIK